MSACLPSPLSLRCSICCMWGLNSKYRHAISVIHRQAPLCVRGSSSYILLEDLYDREHVKESHQALATIDSSGSGPPAAAPASKPSGSGPALATSIRSVVALEPFRPTVSPQNPPFLGFDSDMGLRHVLLQRHGAQSWPMPFRRFPGAGVLGGSA